MQISNFMTPCPYRVSTTMLLTDAVSTMELRNIRHLPVISDDGTIVGVLSERDLELAKSICDTTGYCPTLGDVVTKEPVVVGESDSVATTAERMLETRSDYVLVADASGNVTGIFTSTDALKVIQIYAGEFS